jgi:hypothetical protein
MVISNVRSGEAFRLSCVTHSLLKTISKESLKTFENTNFLLYLCNNKQSGGGIITVANMRSKSFHKNRQSKIYFLYLLL